MVLFHDSSDLSENHSLKARLLFFSLTAYYLLGIFIANGIDKFMGPMLYVYFGFCWDV